MGSINHRSWRLGLAVIKTHSLMLWALLAVINTASITVTRPMPMVMPMSNPHNPQSLNPPPSPEYTTQSLNTEIITLSLKTLTLGLAIRV